MKWFEVFIIGIIEISLGVICFSVDHVQRCPSNEEGWKVASNRIGCNKTHFYHCLPDSNLTTYVELCYPKTLFIKGGCLKYLDNGYIDQVKCEEFFCGCPNESYYGDELYQYPMCLDLFIPKGCFTAHIDCLKLRLCNTSDCFNPPTNASTPDKGTSCVCYWTTVSLIISGTCLLFIIILIICCVWRRTRQKETESTLSEQLKQACRDGDAEMYFTLKEKGNVNLLFAEVDENGWSLLHHAAYGGNDTIFTDLLVKENADTHKITKHSETVLHIAAREGRKEICRLIIENQECQNLLNEKNHQDMNAGHIAARYGHISILEMLINANCRVLENVGTARENIALLACKGKSLEMMKFIGRHQDLTRTLHEQNYEGWTVVHYAAKSGNCDMLEYLIGEMRVDCVNKSTKEKKNCLHTACEQGHYEACKFLLKSEPSMLRLTDIHGNYASHYAAIHGNIKIIKFLRDRGLDLEVRNKENKNILHVACMYAHLDLYKYLAKECPKLLNQRTNRSENAVLFVMRRKDDEDKRIKILNYLVNRGVDVYHVSASGKSALYLACRNKSVVLCEHLLKSYPKFYEMDDGDMNPIEAADGDSRIRVLFSKYNPNRKTSMLKYHLKNICTIS